MYLFESGENDFFQALLRPAKLQIVRISYRVLQSRSVIFWSRYSWVCFAISLCADSSLWFYKFAQYNLILNTGWWDQNNFTWTPPRLKAFLKKCNKNTWDCSVVRLACCFPVLSLYNLQRDCLIVERKRSGDSSISW